MRIGNLENCGRRLENEFNRTPLTQRKYFPTPVKTPEGPGRRDDEAKRRQEEGRRRDQDFGEVKKEVGGWRMEEEKRKREEGGRRREKEEGIWKDEGWKVEDEIRRREVDRMRMEEERRRKDEGRKRETEEEGGWRKRMEEVGEGRIKSSISTHGRLTTSRGNKEIVYNFHNKVGKLEGQIERMVEEVKRMKKDDGLK